jgi:formyltetrahydrofolate-dependent phosphoribosylglycinamide formyltransferase
MSRATVPPIKIAVLISGSGRTLKNLLDMKAEEGLPIDVRLVVSSSAKAAGLEFAREANIETAILLRSKYASDTDYGNAIFAACRAAEVDYVVMAGFLKFAPVPDDFAGRVVNIHPALLPAFGGAGMYGHYVHQAVLDYGARVTGCTVHFVDNQYDHGPVIWQQPVPVFDDDTADSLAARVFSAEKEAYPHVLKLLASGKIRLEGRKVTIGGK